MNFTEQFAPGDAGLAAFLFQSWPWWPAPLSMDVKNKKVLIE